MKRVTYKSIIERSNNSDLPKLKDILVDLSVNSSRPKVVRKLRLIGPQMQFTEFNNRKRISKEEQEQIKKDTGKDKYFEEIPFPDGEQNRNFTRIGHDDDALCPWRKEGYIGTKKYAQRCLEEVDGKWIPKILCKGSSIFQAFAIWEQGRVQEREDDDKLSWFLGGDSAPVVEITATYDTSKLGNVDYKVHIRSKDITLTEDMINSLRAVREPSADDLNKYRQEYEADREEDSTMAEWRDYYEYSYDLRRIFQYTPPRNEVKVANIQEEPEEDVASDASAEGKTASTEEIDLGDINW